MAILNGYEVYPDQKITTTLSMAVWLKDDYTGKPPIGRVEVFLVGQEVKSVKNPSGYYLFLDLPAGQYQVRVESEYYFAVDKTVNLPGPDPVEEITLNPKPSYPFSAGTTLIRGIFLDTAANPISEATVKVVEKAISTITTPKGEFVFYFKGLTDDNVIEENGKWFIKGNPGKVLHLEIVKDLNTWTYQWDIGAVEGMTTALKNPITLS